MGQRFVKKFWIVVAAELMKSPLCQDQYKYIVVFQDLVIRWIEPKPLRTADVKSVAKVFEELILFRSEAPVYLLTDNGKVFDNKTLDGVLREDGVINVNTPLYHRQGKPVKRSNQTLKTMIATVGKSDHRMWDQHLHELIAMLVGMYLRH